MQRYAYWCGLTHGHNAIKNDTGEFVRFTDVQALLKEVLPYVLWHYPDKPLDSKTVALGEKLRAIVEGK